MALISMYDFMWFMNSFLYRIGASLSEFRQLSKHTSATHLVAGVRHA